MFLTVAKHTGHAPFQSNSTSISSGPCSGLSTGPSAGPSSSPKPSTGNDVLYLLALVDYAVLAKRLSVAEGHGLGLASGQGNASGPGLGRGRKDKGPGLVSGAGNQASYALGPGLGPAQKQGLGGLRRAMSLRTTPVNATPTLTGQHTHQIHGMNVVILHLLKASLHC